MPKFVYEWRACAYSNAQYARECCKHLDICTFPPFVCWFSLDVPSMQAAAAPSTQLDDLSQNTPWLRKIKAGCYWLANCFDNKFKQLLSGNILEDMDLWEKTIKPIELERVAQSCCFCFFFLWGGWCSMDLLGDAGIFFLFLLWKTTFHSPTAPGGTKLSCLWDMTQNHGVLINKVSLWGSIAVNGIWQLQVASCMLGASSCRSDKVSWRGRHLCVMHIL